MCPLCLSTAAWLAIGGGSTFSVAALLAGIRKKENDNGDNCDGAPHRDA